jgi:hypothetical protein
MTRVDAKKVTEQKKKARKEEKVPENKQHNE